MDFSVYFDDVLNIAKKNKTKINRADIKFKISNYKDLLEMKITKKELKSIIIKLGLPLKNISSKKKDELLSLTYNLCRLYNYTNVLQRSWRCYMRKLYNKTLGPAFFKRDKSNNLEDFLTTEPINSIDYKHFMSFQDNDGFIYTFNFISLCRLFEKNMIYNPYNRNPFSDSFLSLFKKRIIYNKIYFYITTSEYNLYLPSFTNNNETNNTVNTEQDINNSIRNIFMEIDNVGNYTDPNWLLNLNERQMKKFIYELQDIWEYRAQIDRNIKRQIYPVNGNPFHDVPHHTQMNINNNTYSIQRLKRIIQRVLKRFINYCINDDVKQLSAIYILTALTLVSQEAATSMPWLYQSAL